MYLTHTRHVYKTTFHNKFNIGDAESHQIGQIKNNSVFSRLIMQKEYQILCQVITCSEEFYPSTPLDQMIRFTIDPHVLPSQLVKLIRRWNHNDRLVSPQVTNSKHHSSLKYVHYNR